MEEIKKFYSDILENEAVIILDQKDFNTFSSNVNVITLEECQDYNEWLKRKVVKAKNLIICAFLPKDTSTINLVGCISNILSIFESVKKYKFGVYINKNIKNNQITLIFE